MKRTLVYQIPEEYTGITIQDYLKLQGFSAGNIVDLKKMPDSVFQNGHTAFVIERLQAFDTLTIHIQEENSSERIPPVDIPLEIVYEDEDLMVIEKPAGMPIHPSSNNYYNSLGNAVANYFHKQDCPFIFRCVNRLDHNTSGLTIVAKHMLSGNLLSQAVKRREVHREYKAIVRGSISPARGTITAPIGRREGSIIERMVDFENGVSAVTHYRVLEERNGHSLVGLTLETGRTHQIRVHLQHLGFPLIGDILYNPDMEYIDRQALHSARLEFTHPITGKHMEFTSPLPQDMKKVLWPDA